MLVVSSTMYIYYSSVIIELRLSEVVGKRTVYIIEVHVIGGHHFSQLSTIFRSNNTNPLLDKWIQSVVHLSKLSKLQNRFLYDNCYTAYWIL